MEHNLKNQLDIRYPLILRTYLTQLGLVITLNMYQNNIDS